MRPQGASGFGVGAADSSATNGVAPDGGAGRRGGDTDRPLAVVGGSPQAPPPSQEDGQQVRAGARGGGRVLV